ncbi:hypothetical protein MBLNU230_g4520t1 [Neophaeotheca triangularis]
MEDSRAPREQAPSPLQNTSWSRRSSVVSDLDETQTGLLSESTASRHRSAQTSQASYLPELPFSSFDFDDDASDIASGSKSREYARGNHQEYSNPVHPTFTSSHLGDTHGGALGPAASSHDAVQLQPSDPNRRSSTTTFTSSDQIDQSRLDQLLPVSKNKEQHSDLPKYWNPFWLRKCTLLALAALFASFAAALIVLWQMNESLNGFRLTVSTNHYARTYGPTAVLTVVLSFWRQVDYHCKMLQPWHNLRRGPTDADRSLLLDYLSPIHLTSLYRAARYKNGPVVATILGFLILKVVNLFSTGLLDLAPVSVFEPYPVTFTTKFDPNSIWDTAGHAEVRVSSNSNPRAAYDNISSSPVHAYVNSLEENTVATAGIKEKIAFQSFQSAPGSDLTSISVAGLSLIPNISCEIATSTPQLGGSNQLLVRLDSATCLLGADDLFVMRAQYCGGPAPCRPPDYSDRMKHNVWRVNCSDTDDSLEESSEVDASTPYDLRFAMMVSDLRRMNLTFDLSAENSDSPPNQMAWDELTKVQMSAVICKIDYWMQLYEIQRDFTDNTYDVSPIPSEPRRHFANLTGLMFGELVYAAIDAADSFAIVGDDDTSPLIPLLPRILDGEQSMERLLEPEVLRSTAIQTWSRIGAHFAHENFFLRDGGVEVMGNATRVEDRLLIRAASLWTMVAGLLVVTALSLCLAFAAPRDSVLRDPGLISSDAVVLASSPSLQSFLMRAGTGDLRTSQIRALLHDWRFCTRVDEVMIVNCLHNEQSGRSETPKQKSRDWVPFPARHDIMLLTLALPLVTTIVLEILYRVSFDNKGLVDVSGFENEASYLSRYSSALVALLVATCFNNLDFTTASFTPFDLLQRGRAPANRSMNLRILGALPPAALLRSMRSRHAGSYFSGTAGTIGSVLTMVASGLWVVDRTVIVNQPVAASLSSKWDLGWTNSSRSGDNGAGVLFDRIQHGSASNPTSIHNSTVIPDIMIMEPPADFSVEFDNHSSVAPFASTRNYTFSVDGLRPYLSCQTIEDEHTALSREYEPGRDVRLVVEAFPPVPFSCQRAESGRTTTNYTFKSVHIVAENESSSHSAYLGRFYDLHLGPFEGSFGDAGGIVPEFGEHEFNIPLRDNPAGCPTIGAFLTRVSHDTMDFEDVTAILCSQMIQQVQVSVLYNALDPKNPTPSIETAPEIMENSARNLTNGTDGIETFPFRVQTYLQKDGSSTIGNLTNFVGSTEGSLDGFMDHLIHSPNSTAAIDLVGDANEDKFIDAVSNLYAKYMCLVIDMRFRTSVAGDEIAAVEGDEGYLVGTAEAFSSRLQLNYASKLTIQIMLGVMNLLGACTYLLSNLRGSLPRKPTSIGSRMALLAGSDVCDERKGLLPPEAVRMSDKELDRMFDGWFFSLGWWKRSMTSLDRDTASEGEGARDALHERTNSGNADSAIDREDLLRDGGSGRKAVVEKVEELDRGRFGIDVGIPEKLGFRETKRWVLRRRFARKSDA